MQNPPNVLDAHLVKQISLTTNPSLSTFYIPEAGITVSIANSFSTKEGLKTAVHYILPSNHIEKPTLVDRLLPAAQYSQQQTEQQQLETNFLQRQHLRQTQILNPYQTASTYATNYSAEVIPFANPIVDITTFQLKRKYNKRKLPKTSLPVTDTEIPQILNLSTADLDLQSIFDQLSSISATR